jgi:hypothetical protein
MERKKPPVNHNSRFARITVYLGYGAKGDERRDKIIEGAKAEGLSIPAFLRKLIDTYFQKQNPKNR